MLLQREKSTKNKLLKKWQICSNNNKKKSGSKKLTSVTGVGNPIFNVWREKVHVMLHWFMQMHILCEL